MKLNALAAGVLVLLALAQSGCNGGDADGAGGAGGEGPTGLSVECKTDAECNDGVYCNGEEACEAGQCRYGARITCDDGVDCTLDRCDEASQACVSSGPDKDGDGHFDASCLDARGEPLGNDCDDKDELRFPGAAEICDPEQRDEDCDPKTLGFRDSDNDTYIDALCCNEQKDGKLKCGEDCDDFRTNVNPRSTETCDFVDNNCNGEVDEGKGISVQLFHDKDHDGHGAGKKATTCPGAVGFAGDDTDCDDDDPEVFLGQFEICDGKDNNCDPKKLADEIEEQAPWFPDTDGDTYGDPTVVPVWSCYPVSGRVLSHNDCSDSNKKVNPNAPEICDALDNDCNGLADFRLSGVNNFEDDDQDGSPDAACKGPEPNDCDDRDPRTSGGAIEVCDHADNDCDGEVDEQTSQNIWYIDEDGDGWGVVIGSALASCDPLPARARQFGDCNDDKSSATANSTHPGSLELCDGIDNNCDGSTDEGAAAYCHLANAIAGCKTGRCSVFACQAGYADTNGDPEDGCEDTFVPVISATPCVGNLECDDGNLCTGFEHCLGGFCASGTLIDCTASSGTLDGDVAIRNIQDVHNLAGIDTITGDVVIENTSLTSLVGLEGLKVIGGNLTIQNNPKLTKLSGSALSDLETVGGVILVENNQLLTSADLPGLYSAKALIIRANPALVTLKGFGNLIKTEELRIESNPVLTKLEGFPSLSRIGGRYNAQCTRGYCYADCQSGLIVDSQTYPVTLPKISAFAALEQIEGDLCLTGEFAGVKFPALTRVGMAVYLQGSGETADFPALNHAGRLSVMGFDGSAQWDKLVFPELTSVDNDVNVSNESYELDLASLEAASAVSIGIYYIQTGTPGALTLPKLKTAESLQIYSNYSLLTEISLPALTDVVGDLSITYSSAVSPDPLTKISLPKLTKASSVYVSVSSNEADAYPFPALASIDLNKLATVDLQISVTAPFVPPNGSPGLELGSLTLVGTDDVDGDTKPDNNGSLRLCTGILNAQTAVYDNAACTQVSDIARAGYVGVADTCGQCQ